MKPCTMCSRPVRRSWVTGILHKKCRACRYLIMMYGPNIRVRLVHGATKLATERRTLQ